jgi:hypothetical protein
MDQFKGEEALMRGPLFGVFLAGQFGSSRFREKSALLVRIPYLGIERRLEAGEPESWSLAEYRSRVLLGRGEGSGVVGESHGGEEIPVHEALLIVFNNGLCAFRCWCCAWTYSPCLQNW